MHIHTRMYTPMKPAVGSNLTFLSQIRLLQLLSPVSPVGGYSYSQGLEWAVGEGWVNDEDSFARWVSELISSTLSEQDLPLLRKLYVSVKEGNFGEVKHWSQFSIAVRDTAELRFEERCRAEAMLKVLESIKPLHSDCVREDFLNTPLLSMAWFCVQNNIELQALLTAYAYNWLENTVVTGMKIIPFGQSAGQRMLYGLGEELEDAIKQSLNISDDCIGISLPAISMASSSHEVQYSRIYRS